MPLCKQENNNDTFWEKLRNNDMTHEVAEAAAKPLQTKPEQCEVKQTSTQKGFCKISFGSPKRRFGQALLIAGRDELLVFPHRKLRTHKVA
jgi:uncharacterized Fe-S radical SAM superfamily protein PflX